MLKAYLPQNCFEGLKMLLQFWENSALILLYWEKNGTAGGVNIDDVAVA